MGCNQTIEDHALHAPRLFDIPCTPQDVGKYLNDIRENPTKYADLIEKDLSKFVDEYSIEISPKIIYRTNQGKSVYQETVQFLRKQEPLPPLQIHQGLCKASACHAEDIAGRNELTHTGLDNSEPIERISRYCRKNFGKSGENISTQFRIDGRNYAQNTVIWLVIDDGVSDRGHRNSVFDKDFKYFGSASRTQEDKVLTVITYLSQNWQCMPDN